MFFKNSKQTSLSLQYPLLYMLRVETLNVNLDKWLNKTFHPCEEFPCYLKPIQNTELRKKVRRRNALQIYTETSRLFYSMFMCRETRTNSRKENPEQSSSILYKRVSEKKPSLLFFFLQPSDGKIFIET